MIEAVENNWSTRELERQINSLLFERLALSREKGEVINIDKRGQEITRPCDLVKDPYVIEFLGLQEGKRLLEKELEQALIDHLQEFLLELGKGFSVVKFTLPVEQEQIFVSKYKLYLPTEDELKREIIREKVAFEIEHHLAETTPKIE